MTVRLEWAKTRDTGVYAYERGEILDDGNIVGEDFAVSVGSQVIEGTAEDLLALLAEAAALVESIVEGRGGTLVYEGAMPDGMSVTVRYRNDGYQLFVGGWRIDTFRTRKVAVGRAEYLTTDPAAETIEERTAS